MIYPHNCQKCNFVSTIQVERENDVYLESEVVDGYVCKNSINQNHGSVILRYGGNAGDYWSCPIHLLEQLPPDDMSNTARKIVRQHLEGRK